MQNPHHGPMNYAITRLLQMRYLTLGQVDHLAQGPTASKNWDNQCFLASPPGERKFHRRDRRCGGMSQKKGEEMRNGGKKNNRCPPQKESFDIHEHLAAPSGIIVWENLTSMNWPIFILVFCVRNPSQCKANNAECQNLILLNQRECVFSSGLFSVLSADSWTVTSWWHREGKTRKHLEDTEGLRGVA